MIGSTHYCFLNEENSKTWHCEYKVLKAITETEKKRKGGIKYTV